MRRSLSCCLIEKYYTSTADLRPAREPLVLGLPDVALTVGGLVGRQPPETAARAATVRPQRPSPLLFRCQTLDRRAPPWSHQAPADHRGPSAYSGGAYREDAGCV